MKRKEFGERWSFIWLVIATIVIVCGAFLISDTLKDKAVEEIVVTVEHFERGSGTAKELKGGRHFDELETGLLINEESLEMLAHIIHGEAGSNWCSDTMQLGVGSVVLNRINDSRFPNSMYEVITQQGQYSCLNTGYKQTPSERAYKNARYLLENGPTLPENVVFQANFTQGNGTYLHEQNMYFCY